MTNDFTRLEQERLGTLLDEWQLRNEKLRDLRRAYAIEAAAGIRFQLKRDIEAEETRITELKAELTAFAPLDIDSFVQAVRVNLYDTVQNKCGSMRVLDMSQPIALNSIYTAVNILEKITGRRRLEMAELLQT